jgi:hypothetical protein
VKQRLPRCPRCRGSLRAVEQDGGKTVGVVCELGCGRTVATFERVVTVTWVLKSGSLDTDAA